MAWLRLYDDLLDNPKIQRLPDKAFRGLINLWCVAKRHDGIIPLDIGVLIFALRLSEGKVRELLQTLLSAGLIERDAEGYIPHQWTEHQYQSDVTAAERMKRYRERNKDRNVTRNALQKMSRNSDVLEQRQSTETETETPKPPHASRSVLNGSKELFEAFYQVYPLHKARRAAEKAYVSALKRTTPEAILAGARRYADDPARKPDFTKHPASWLNADGWLDETEITPETSTDLALKRIQELEKNGA